MRAARVGFGATSMNVISARALTPDPSPAIGRGGGLIAKVFARMFALREQNNGARISRVLQNQEGGSELQPRSRPCGRGLLFGVPGRNENSQMQAHNHDADNFGNRTHPHCRVSHLTSSYVAPSC